MKKTITIATIFLGVFMMAGIVSASDADILQPASTIIYNEDLTVNGTGRFDSVYIGKQGVGGVTFFNGTIVNSTNGEGGSDNPVTFGDGVRIDGLIWGGPNKGNASDQGLKIADTLLPGLTNINDLGSSSLRWDNLYVQDVNISGSIIVKDINASGVLKINGDIIQNKNANGALKAAAYCEKSMASTSAWKKAKFYFNNLDNDHGIIYCAGPAFSPSNHFRVRFGENEENLKYNMKDKFIQLQPIKNPSSSVSDYLTAESKKLITNGNTIEVFTHVNGSNVPEDFMIYVY